MKIKWLNKKNNPYCILFFNGWGMDEYAVSHLEIGNFDLCMFNDYSTVEKIKPKFKEYDEVYLVAWSLGVWAANKALLESDIIIKKSIALNGTLKPIDEREGIAPNIFRSTLENWDGRNRSKFNLRVLGGKKQYDLFSEMISKRSLSCQKAELESIYREAVSVKIKEMDFDVAFIGTNDLIFASKNQKKHWNNKTRIVMFNTSHFPFINFENWNEIIEL